MIQKDDSKVIEVMHSICCGLDVHKDGTIFWQLSKISLK